MSKGVELCVLVFGGVRYVSSNPPHDKNTLHSCPSDIENAPIYVLGKIPTLNRLKMARTVAGCHKFSKKFYYGAYIDQKWRSLGYIWDIMGRYGCVLYI